MPPAPGSEALAVELSSASAALPAPSRDVADPATEAGTDPDHPPVTQRELRGWCVHSLAPCDVAWQGWGATQTPQTSQGVFSRAPNSPPPRAGTRSTRGQAP